MIRYTVSAALHVGEARQHSPRLAAADCSSRLEPHSDNLALPIAVAANTWAVSCSTARLRRHRKLRRRHSWAHHSHSLACMRQIVAALLVSKMSALAPVEVCLRPALREDVDALYALEAASYPADEAASREALATGSARPATSSAS